MGKSPALPEELQKVLDNRSKKSWSEIWEEKVDNPAYYKTANNPVLKEDYQSRLKRKLWASHGASSGTDPADLFPSKDTVAEMLKAEEEWWPTLEEMKSNIKAREDALILKRKLKQEQIDENMK